HPQMPRGVTIDSDVGLKVPLPGSYISAEASSTPEQQPVSSVTQASPPATRTRPSGRVTATAPSRVTDGAPVGSKVPPLGSKIQAAGAPGKASGSGLEAPTTNARP